MEKNNQITLSKSYYLVLFISFNVIFCNNIKAQYNKNLLPKVYTGIYFDELNANYLPVDTNLPEPLILYYCFGYGYDTLLLNTDKICVKTSQESLNSGRIKLVNPDTIYRLHYIDSRKEYKYLPIYLCKYRNVKELHYYKSNNRTVDTTILCLQKLTNLEIIAGSEMKLTQFPFFISKLKDLSFLSIDVGWFRHKKKKYEQLTNIKYFIPNPDKRNCRVKFSKQFLGMPNIEYLFLTNGFKPSIPNLKSYKRLKLLDIRCCKLQNIKKIINGCDSIQEVFIFDLKSKELSANTLDELLSFKQLKKIHIHYTKPVIYDIDKIRAVLKMYKKQNIEIKIFLKGNPELKEKKFLISNNSNKNSILNDNDPAFTDFLQAGYARVVVPVQPKFTEAILHYLKTREIWLGEEMPGIDDELYLSIIDEIKTRDGNQEEIAVGEPWDTRVPTNLIMLTDIIPTELPGWNPNI